MTLTFIDIVILIVVLIILGLIIYFAFIRNRSAGPCRNCSQAKTISGNRLLKDYKKKNKDLEK